MIGSIVPDFPYFIRAFGVASFAHSFLGAVVVSLPLGFALYLLVSQIFGSVAKALPAPHPGFLLSWSVEKPSGMRAILGIASAVLIGALLHNFVDSFTHEPGAAVRLFPFLRTEATAINGEPLPVFRILQYGGSILGLVMLLIGYWSGLRRYCRALDCVMWQDSRRWLELLALVAGTVLLATALNFRLIPRAFDFYEFRVFGFKFLITWLPIFGLVFLAFVRFRNSPKQT